MPFPLKNCWHILIVFAALVGCTQAGSWQNTNVPEEQWTVDRDACTGRAREQAEREFTLDQQSTRSLNYGLGGQWQSDMNRFSGQRRQQQLFDSCMTERGYVFVPTPAEQG